MNRLLLFVAAVALSATSLADQDVNIVYVGNSITYGARLADPGADAPPVKASQHISRQRPDLSVSFRNCGAGGMTTVDFLPATATQFARIVGAGRELGGNGGRLVFSISLGTNDSAESHPLGAPVLPQQYFTNMQAIISELLRLFPDCRVVVHGPIWYSPNTYNNAVYLQAGLDRLNTYRPLIPQLVEYYAEVNPGHVFLGDTCAYDAFENHPELFDPESGNAGTFYLHPNRQGAAMLGRLWADAILKAL